MLERDVERKARELAKRRGCLLFKWVSPGRAGVPDRILFVPGAVHFIEFKAPGKKPTPLQKVMHDRLRALGASVHVIDSVDTFADLLPAAVPKGRHKPPLL
jgi:hypothetical protein